MTHKEVVQIAYQWVLKSGGCGVAFKELNSLACNGEYPDVLGVMGWGKSVLIEVKVSRSDFCADKKKSFRKNPELGMGTFRYYCCPEGLIKPTELPDGWGLIYVNIKGKAKCVFNPYNRINPTNGRHPGFKQNLQAEHGLMYSALRRLHLKGHIETIYDKQYNYTGVAASFPAVDLFTKP